MDNNGGPVTRGLAWRASCWLLLAWIWIGANVLAADPGAGTNAPPGIEAKTEHYDFYLEGLELGDLGRVAEASYQNLARFFGREAPERFRVEIYATEARYREALKADLVHEDKVTDESAGLYSSRTRKAYLYAQPTRAATRRTMLHEMAHQFHFRVSATNVWPRLWLYSEGLAEHFAQHRWDGIELLQGIVPKIDPNEHPAKALESFRGETGRDFKALISGRKKADYPQAWAVMHFLLTERAEALGRWRELMDMTTPTFSQTNPLLAWNSTYGPVTPELSARFESWLASQVPPWRVVFGGDWEDRGERLVATSVMPSIHLAVLRTTPETFSVTLRPESSNAVAGVVFGYAAANDWHVLKFQGRKIHWNRRQGEAYDVQREWTYLKDDRSIQVELSIATNHVEIRLGGDPLGKIEATGAVGLMVHDGTVGFVPAWKPMAAP